MPNPIDYFIENRKFRDKIVTAYIYFSVIGGTITTISMLMLGHYR
jgi:lipid-A-disaccharide synthase-like uncharacterized protein